MVGKWKINFKESLIDMFWENLKPFKELYEKKINFFSVYKVSSWKVKIGPKGHSIFVHKLQYQIY